MKINIISLKLFAILLFSPLTVLFSQDSLIISEFMAINNETLQDEDGTYSDWIEIYNGHSIPVNLSGWGLSDDQTNFLKWEFPAISIDPQEYIVVFASGKDRVLEKDKLHTNFKLSGSGEFLALSNPGILKYNSVFSPAYPEQYDNISYAYYNGSYIYSSIPTPGEVSDSGVFVSVPMFSSPHGFYDESFNLSLTSIQDEAAIYYTTDASTPSISNGTLYSGAIEISETTVIRAIALIDGTASSSSVTSSYIFAEDAFNQFENQPGYPDTWLQPTDYLEYREIDTHYGMNSATLGMGTVSTNLIASIKSLPTISIASDIDNLFSKDTAAETGGIYMYSGESNGSTAGLLYHLGRGWERAASIEYFNSSEEDGSLDFQENCGIKIHGGASRTTRKTLKRSFKIGFKAIYGPTKLKETIFGEDSPNQYDRLILRGGFDNRLENQVVDPWVKSTMRDMGHYAARSKFVHLYLNGMYWGMYNLSEQMDENCMSDNLGGSASDYDIIKDYYEIEAGDAVAWDQLISQAKNTENYQALLGNQADGSPDPSKEKLLNADNLIDYIINISYNNPWDWDNHNWAAARKRTNSDGFHFIVWDAESGLTTGDKISWIMEGGFDGGNRPSSLFSDLMKNQEFSDLFISRVNRSLFQGGALTPDPGLDRYTRWLAELDTALIADQARWYANTNDIWNISQHSFIYSFFPNNTETLFKQFISEGIYPNVEKPGFNTSYSRIPESFQLLMTGPEGAEIRYTVDGTDPGHFSLSSNESIVVYRDSIILPEVGEKLTIYARTKQDTLWSSLVKKSFTIEDDPDTVSIDNSIASENYLACYPNPMQDYTNIKYSLSEQAYVSLNVYTITGIHVTTLENRVMDQGEHLIKWDSRNNPPGIYFCILSDIYNTTRHKIMLIKK